jgi:hypothetical protein
MADPETFLGLGNVGNSEVAQAVEDATAAKIAPDNADVALTGDKNATIPSEDGKEQDVNSLTDEQFEKLVARIASDSKLPYHKNPAWQRIISQRNQSTQKTDAYLKRLASKDPQGAIEMLLDEGMDDTQARVKLHQMGVDLNASQDEQPLKKESAPKQEVDEGEFIKLLNNMGVKYEQLTPEQIQFWKFQYQFNNQMMQPVQKFVEQSKTEKQKAAETEKRKSFEKEEAELSKEAKEKYGLDWEKECLPEMFNYLKTNPEYRGTPRQLFKEVFFDKVMDLGKRAKSVEDAKLNDEKKRITSENGGSSGGETKPAGVGKNFHATWEWLNSKNK